MRVKLLDDAKQPVGELEVEVDPNGADFQPTTGGIAWLASSNDAGTLACLIAHAPLAVGWHVS